MPRCTRNVACTAHGLCIVAGLLEQRHNHGGAGKAVSELYQQFFPRAAADLRSMVAISVGIESSCTYCLLIGCKHWHYERLSLPSLTCHHLLNSMVCACAVCFLS